MKKLVEEIRRTRGYENLIEYLGEDLGTKLYQLVHLCDKENIKSPSIDTNRILERMKFQLSTLKQDISFREYIGYEMCMKLFKKCIRNKSWK
jgi:hypothetical protein